jgi:hypothetical protein
MASASCTELSFCSAEPGYKLLIRLISGKTLGDYRRGGASDHTTKALQALRVAGCKLVKKGREQPNGSETNPKAVVALSRIACRKESR